MCCRTRKFERQNFESGAATLRTETACAFNAEVKTRAVSEESGAKFQQLPILHRVPQTVGMELKQKRHSVNSGGEGDGGGAKIAT